MDRVGQQSFGYPLHLVIRHHLLARLQIMCAHLYGTDLTYAFFRKIESEKTLEAPTDTVLT